MNKRKTKSANKRYYLLTLIKNRKKEKKKGDK